MNLPLTIHPFPARMAPDIALAQMQSLPAGAVVLDPMAGSGTVPRVAADAGHQALGYDLDPLAVLMAKVWTTAIDVTSLREGGRELVERLKRQPEQPPSLPWIDEDPETRAYVDYWFAPPQQVELRRLSAALNPQKGEVGDALRLALSRIIITKDRGASLARDVSHSRPHRVRLTNDFPVLAEFARSVARLADRLAEQPPPGNARIGLGDARSLAGVAPASVDAVITSPPYLNAIDYLRGHRLSLVWLGHRVGELRAIRGSSIGAEHQPDVAASADLTKVLTAPLGPLEGLPRAEQRMVDRYVLDLHAMLREIYRVLKSGGRAVFVVGNSCVRGVFVKNARALAAIAERVGFTLVTDVERELPPNKRYLPPPREQALSNLAKRMRTESVLTFRR